jgi:hypothetical protein
MRCICPGDITASPSNGKPSTLTKKDLKSRIIVKMKTKKAT